MHSFLDATGSLGRGGFAARFLVTLAVAAALIVGSLHYVGKVWPHEYQLKQLEAKEREVALGGGKSAEAAPGHDAPAAGTAASSAGTAAPAAGESHAATTAAPASGTAAPATATAMTTASPAATTTAATTAAPAADAHAAPAATAAPGVLPGEGAAAPVGAPGAPLPQGVTVAPAHHPSLSGFDRHAFGNMAIFMGIVIAAYAGAILLALAIRRLRDMGWKSMWSLGIFVPGVNVLLVLAMLLVPSNPAAAHAHGDDHGHAH